MWIFRFLLKDLEKGKPSHALFKLTKLSRFATTQTHFYFDGKIFDQDDGVAIDSPLGSALVNLFMGFNEQKWLESDHGRLNVLP